MPEEITVVQASNARIRIFKTERTMSNFTIAFFSNDFDRYDTGVARFKQIGSIGEQIVKRIFRECPDVKNVYIQPTQLTITVKDIKGWNEVEKQIRVILTDVLYTVHQNY